MYLRVIRCFSLLITTPSSKAGPPQVDQTWVHVPSILGQLGSFLLIQSHWLQRSEVCDVSFMVWRRACPWIARSLRNLRVDVAKKPLQPTSTGQKSPSLWPAPTAHSWSVEEALSVPVPPSWTNVVLWTEVLNGKALVAVIFVSIVAARHLSTWLCLYIYLPWERLILQPVRMCLRVAGVEHSGQDGSSFSHCCRFLGEGRTCCSKQETNLACFNSHRFFQQIFLFSVLSHFIHCPCLSWVTASAHLAASSWHLIKRSDLLPLLIEMLFDFDLLILLNIQSLLQPWCLFPDSATWW